MIRLASSTSPVDMAWAAFDASVLRLNHLYRLVDLTTDTFEDRAVRMKLAMETARLWDEWRTLYLAPDAGDAA